jgi:hypothetical protein
LDVGDDLVEDGHTGRRQVEAAGDRVQLHGLGATADPVELGAGASRRGASRRARRARRAPGRLFAGSVREPETEHELAEGRVLGAGVSEGGLGHHAATVVTTASRRRSSLRRLTSMSRAAR